MEDWLTEPHTRTYNPIANGNSIVSRYPWLTRYPPKLRLWNNRGYLLVKRIFDLTVVIVGSLRFCVEVPYMGGDFKQRHGSLQGQDKGAGKEL